MIGLVLVVAAGGGRAEKTENTETGSPGGSKNTCRGSHHYTMAHLWSVNNQSQRRPLGRYYYYIFSVKRIFKGSLPIRFSNNIKHPQILAKILKRYI